MGPRPPRSWNCGASSVAAGGSPYGFNGATTARSWNCFPTLPEIPEAKGLQWGHDRAVVELEPRMILRAARVPLQWGHDRAVVEFQEHLREPRCIVSFNGATTARSWNSSVEGTPR